MLREGLADGAPDQLLGHRVELSEDMPAVAANAFPIIFANWRLFYLIVDHRRGTQVLRDPFTDKPSVLLYTTRRVGGAVANFEAGKVMKIST